MANKTDQTFTCTILFLNISSIIFLNQGGNVARRKSCYALKMVFKNDMSIEIEL